MKKHFQNSVILLISMFGLLSCSKSDDTTPATASYISMKINGVEWKSSVGAGAISTDGLSATGTLDVTGGKDALVISMLNPLNVGTAYKFEDTNDRVLQFIKQSSKITYMMGKAFKNSSGVITITKTKVIGSLTYANATFSGTAVGSDGSKIVITEGMIVNSQVN
jgi:hypothetical protein